MYVLFLFVLLLVFLFLFLLLLVFNFFSLFSFSLLFFSLSFIQFFFFFFLIFSFHFSFSFLSLYTYSLKISLNFYPCPLNHTFIFLYHSWTHIFLYCHLQILSSSLFTLTFRRLGPPFTLSVFHLTLFSLRLVPYSPFPFTLTLRHPKPFSSLILIIIPTNSYP